MAATEISGTPRGRRVSPTTNAAIPIIEQMYNSLEEQGIHLGDVRKFTEVVRYGALGLDKARLPYTSTAKQKISMGQNVFASVSDQLRTEAKKDMTAAVEAFSKLPQAAPRTAVKTLRGGEDEEVLAVKRNLSKHPHGFKIKV